MQHECNPLDRALLDSILLDRQYRKDNHILAIMAHMKGMRSYISVVSFAWINQRVGYAFNLPMFAYPHSTDQDIDTEIINPIKIAKPDYSKQLEMTLHLATNKTNITPITVIAYQPWVSDPIAEQWGENSIAMYDSLYQETLNSELTYFDVELNGTCFYVIHGQEQVVAIAGLHELIKNNRLQLKDKEGNNLDTTITLDEVIKDIKIKEGITDKEIHGYMQVLMGQSIGIEIIPAVLHAESYQQALHRLNRTFIEVNKQPRPN